MNLLREYLLELGFTIDDKKLEQFKKYMEFLIEYNKNVNLTSITDHEGIIVKHFIDSIMVELKIEMPDKAKLIDVGTGAGFPGVPLKIVNPNINLTLLDSLNKRLIFLKELIKLIDIDAEIIHSRAEDLSKKCDYRETFDIATSRAVAPLNILAEYCIPLIRIGGKFVAMKSDNIENEIKESESAIKKLGCELTDVKRFNLPDGSSRSLVIVTKKHSTSSKYPRLCSKIKKNPL